MAKDVESPLARPPGLVPRVLREFLATEVAGGLVLVGAALVALAWANSPWRAGYESFWQTDAAIRVGRHVLELDLRHWVNDGLMAAFFFVVGVEVTREVTVGELASWRRAALPAVAAVGGMIVPALLYFAVNAGGAGAHGWGIPMATDIAFALGVVALVGPRVAPGVKVFLLTLAIVDDIGAVVVIAIFYSSGITWAPLVGAIVTVGLVAVARRFGVRWPPVYLALGLVAWYLTLKSGVHATIAGVALGLLVPTRPLTPGLVAHEWAASLSDDPTPAEMRALTRLASSTVSPAERVEHDLHPFTSLFVIPVFALANAGVRLEGSSLRAPGAGAVVAGIVLGLVVGKFVGVTGATWAAMRLRLGTLPEGVGSRDVLGIGAVAGVGFTVSLFVADLAFTAPGLRAAAKVGILAASLIASLVGLAAFLVLTSRRPRV